MFPDRLRLSQNGSFVVISSENLTTIPVSAHTVFSSFAPLHICPSNVLFHRGYHQVQAMRCFVRVACLTVACTQLSRFVRAVVLVAAARRSPKWRRIQASTKEKGVVFSYLLHICSAACRIAMMFQSITSTVHLYSFENPKD